MGTNDRCWLIIQKLLRIAQPFRERNRAETICCSALKSICFMMISAAFANTSSHPHLSASPPTTADNFLVVMSLTRSTTPSAFDAKGRKLSIKVFDVFERLVCQLHGDSFLQPCLHKCIFIVIFSFNSKTALKEAHPEREAKREYTVYGRTCALSALKSCAWGFLGQAHPRIL